VGVFAGPDVSESGLVLALDGANYKSFKGEATTNELVSVTWSGDGSAQSGMPFGSAPVTDENLKYKGYETYLWSPGTSRNCYLNGADVSSSRTSTVWTFSCYVKREDGAPITSLSVYMYYPSSDGAAAGTIQDVGDGWYRVSRTRTGANSYIALAGFTGFASGYKYYLSGAQLEKKSYPTTVVATNTTRGTTVATGGGWADLTGNGNNGELVNGVRESSDNLGALSFDGSNEYVNGNITLGQDATIEFIAKANWNQDNSGTPIPVSIDGNNYNSGPQPFFYSNKINWNTGNGGNNPFSNSYMPDTNWHVFTISNNFSSGVATLYIDGVLIGTATALNMTTTGNNKLWIGRWHGGGYNVNMNFAALKIYNRALTAAEVQQNFNANRGRFGI